MPPTTTIGPVQPKVALWVICPVCKKERRISKYTGEILHHRRWIPRAVLEAHYNFYDAQNLPLDPYEYGRMVTCHGPYRQSQR